MMSEVMGVDITPELLGANLLLKDPNGKDFSLSTLTGDVWLQIFPQDENIFKPKNIITNLEFITRQLPCGITGRVIANHFGDSELNSKFTESHSLNRGVIFKTQCQTPPSMTLKPDQIVVPKYIQRTVI